MAIFKIENKKVKQLGLKEDGFGDEFSLRDFFAENNNLNEILGVRFLEKEYTIPGARIDTLGLDEDNSPVIIEYKWKENKEVFAQGLSYLNWLIKNKSHFELLVKDKLGNDIEINWDQPRVILIAQDFSPHVKSAVQTIDSVELKTYTLYEGNILHIENEYSPFPTKEHSKKQIISDKNTTYDLKYHLSITSPELQQKVKELREKILNLPSIEEKLGQKTGITYRTTKSFTRLEVRKNYVQVLLREPKYSDDTLGLVKDITTNAWGYLGMVKMTPETNMEYIFKLIEASYNSTL